MTTHQWAFAALNVVGASAVRASYVWGLRSLSTTWWFAAAAGFSPATYTALTAVGDDDARVGGKLGTNIFCPIDFLILIPSALWFQTASLDALVWPTFFLT